MTIRDFYQSTHGADRITIKRGDNIKYRGKIRDIPLKFFEEVIISIGVDYNHFTFIVSV